MAKIAVEAVRKVDIRQQRRAGRIPPDADSASFVIGSGPPITVTIHRRTDGQIAGARLFFCCPRCDRTCEILYALRSTLACRLCHRLAYGTENLSAICRTTSRNFRLRSRLGQWADTAMDPYPEKPKWMRWPTYDRRIAQLEACDARASALLWAAVSRLQRRG